MKTNSLPVPTPEALVHSQALKNHLDHYIQNKGGKISFSDYMQQALYAQGLGYYVAGSRKLGAAGDFITSPEISPLFSYCVANFIGNCHLDEGRAESASILELGAGSGQMALNMLLYFIDYNISLKNYFILEISPDLKDRQKDLLQKNLTPEWYQRITWLDQLPQQFQGIIVANEVLDALPVERFIKLNDSIVEIGVCVENNQLKDCLLETASPELINTIENLQNELGFTFPEDYSSEICLQLPAFINSLADCLQQGCIIFIDYGFLAEEYYHPQRHMGTLICHYRHHAHDDPYFYPGLQDITANVDFSAVMLAAENCGLEISLYQSQSHFLLENKLLDFAQQKIDAKQDDDVNRLKISQQIQKLTNPYQMGERFKVIVLEKNKNISCSKIDSSL